MSSPNVEAVRNSIDYSDPDASWGHRSAVSTRKGGGYYGFKVDMAVCSRTGGCVSEASSGSSFTPI